MQYKQLTDLSNNEIKSALKAIFKPKTVEFIKKNKDNNTVMAYLIGISCYSGVKLSDLVTLREDGLELRGIDTYKEKLLWQQFLLSKGCHYLLKDNPFMGQQCLLISSDGESISYELFDSKDKAVKAMEQAYRESCPSEDDWDEGFKEMSYLCDDSATLYTGEDVYVWQIAAL